MSEHISLTPDPAHVSRLVLNKGDRVRLLSSADDPEGIVCTVSDVDEETGAATIDIPPAEPGRWKFYSAGEAVQP